MSAIVLTKDLPEWVAEKAARKAKASKRQDREARLSGKPFSTLTKEEKDELLEELLVKNGLCLEG